MKKMQEVTLQVISEVKKRNEKKNLLLRQQNKRITFKINKQAFF